MTPPSPLTADALAATPAWFPHLVDPTSDRAILVAKNEADYREASFLDDRSLRSDRARRVIEWRQIQVAMVPSLRRDAQYIFHIGHVGSTLLSRLLGELDTVLALREPMVLRTLAEAYAEGDSAEALWDPAGLSERADAINALFSRSYRPEQRAMVKATSFTSEIAPKIVSAASQALLLHTSAERYVAGILAGDNSRQELALTAPARLKRLHRRAGARWRLWQMSEGERIAMAWAAEMTSLRKTSQALVDRAAWLDFDSFLRKPAAGLHALAAFFGHALNERGAQALASHRLMTRYSKAPEHEYSPQLREDVLADARRQHGPEIAAAMRWLDAASRDVPEIAACRGTPQVAIL